MTCISPHQIPLHCPNCNLVIGQYMLIGETVMLYTGFNLYSVLNGKCFCGYEFVDMCMPKNWQKFKRRYEERING